MDIREWGNNKLKKSSHMRLNTRCSRGRAPVYIVTIQKPAYIYIYEHVFIHEIYTEVCREIFAALTMTGVPLRRGV